MTGHSNPFLKKKKVQAQLALSNCPRKHPDPTGVPTSSSACSCWEDQKPQHWRSCQLRGT